MSGDGAASALVCDLLEDGRDAVFRDYRRPGLALGADGTLLAYYEAQRFEGGRAQSLICRASRDAGKSWSERVVIASGGAAGMLHNIMMVWAEGCFHCLWNVQYRQLWYANSRDGLEWSEPRDMTRNIWRADSDYPWNAFGIGSGHALRLKSGRILVPSWFTTGGDGHKPSAFGNIYTDDLFESVHIGATLQSGEEILNPNEGAIVELPDGDVLATVRHDNPCRARAMARSRGGVERWRDVSFREDLPDPICHASMFECARGLLFMNCANADPDWKRKYDAGEIRYIWSDDARKNLTLRASTDGGAHFGSGVRIAEKGGYSDMACADGYVVCVYETGWNLEDSCIFPHQIGVARLPLELVFGE